MSGWSPTSVHVGLPVSSLTEITALTEPTPVTEAVAGSFDEIRTQVQDAIRDWLEAITGGDVWAYVLDIGPTWAVYELGACDDLWLVSYTIDDAGSVSLSAPVAVMRVTTYVPEPPEPGESADGADMGDPMSEAIVPGSVSLADRLEGRVLGAVGAGADGGRIFAVQIIAYGDSKNSRRYPESVMRAAAALYEGKPAYDHHRTLAELNSGTVEGIVGWYRNVTADGVGLQGELHLLPSANHVAELLDQTIANQAEGLPPLVGISHDVMTASKPISVNGRPMIEVTDVLSVSSADVVVTPAAGGQATRMVAGGAGSTDHPTTPPKENTPVTLKQLLAALRVAESAEARAALLAQYGHVLESAGITADDAIRMAEALTPATVGAPAPTTTTPAPAAVPARTAEAVEPLLRRGSMSADVLIERALASAALPPAIAPSISAELPEQFTEAELLAKVASHKRLLETFELAGLAPTVPHRGVEATRDERDRKIAALDAMFAGDFRTGYRSFKEAYVDFTGAAPRSTFDGDFNRQVLRESASILTPDGERIGFDSSARSTESATTSTWGNALGDSITRRMVAEYEQPSLQSWRSVVSSIVPVQDFRLQRIERMGGYGVLPAVAQGAPYQPLTTPGNDAEPQYTLSKRGGTEDLTLEMIANDDMRLIARIPTKLGLAAAQTIFRFVWDFFATNPTVYDSTALFAAGHNNTAASALSGATLSTARKAMRKQTAYGDASNLLSAVPKFLITCSDLEELAYQLCTSPGAMPSGAPVGAATNIPNIHQGVQPIVVDYWSSTTAWFVVADPAMIPTLELGFYQGKQDPELFVQSDPSTGSFFNADKATYKVRHIYSGAVLDFRGFQRGNS